MPISLVLSDEEQAVVDKGEAASFLLRNPLFLEAVDAVRSDCAEAILRSDPAAKEARESAYHLSRALSAVTVALDDLAARGEAIAATHEQQHVLQFADADADDVDTN